MNWWSSASEWTVYSRLRWFSVTSSSHASRAARRSNVARVSSTAAVSLAVCCRDVSITAVHRDLIASTSACRRPANSGLAWDSSTADTDTIPSTVGCIVPMSSCTPYNARSSSRAVHNTDDSWFKWETVCWSSRQTQQAYDPRDVRRRQTATVAVVHQQDRLWNWLRWSVATCILSRIHRHHNAGLCRPLIRTFFGSGDPGTAMSLRKVLQKPQASDQSKQDKDLFWRQICPLSREQTSDSVSCAWSVSKSPKAASSDVKNTSISFIQLLTPSIWLYTSSASCYETKHCRIVTSTFIAICALKTTKSIIKLLITYIICHHSWGLLQRLHRDYAFRLSIRSYDVQMLLTQLCTLSHVRLLHAVLSLSLPSTMSSWHKIPTQGKRIITAKSGRLANCSNTRDILKLHTF